MEKWWLITWGFEVPLDFVEGILFAFLCLARPGPYSQWVDQSLDPLFCEKVAAAR